jgi:hypothetical protein
MAKALELETLSTDTLSSAEIVSSDLLWYYFTVCLLPCSSVYTLTLYTTLPFPLCTACAFGSELLAAGSTVG